MLCELTGISEQLQSPFGNVDAARLQGDAPPGWTAARYRQITSLGLYTSRAGATPPAPAARSPKRTRVINAGITGNLGVPHEEILGVNSATAILAPGSTIPAVGSVGPRTHGSKQPMQTPRNLEIECEA